MQWQTKRITKLAFMLALGLILSYIESLIPFYFGIPGAKLGLSNLMVVMILYTYGIVDAIEVNLLRIVVSGILFGNLYGVMFSLAGALFSISIMYVLMRFTKHKVTVVSMAGGVFHNLGQMIVAAIMISKYSFFYYLPFLIVSGIITGFLIGKLSEILLKRGIL